MKHLIFATMKHLLLIPLLALGLTAAYAQEAMFPALDAKVLGMGGVAMTAVSGSHTIYNNPAMAAFSTHPWQVSSSYCGIDRSDYYAVTGYWRFNYLNDLQLGWRQLLREKGNNDMAVDIGYSRRIGDRWAVGAVTRYQRLKRPDAAADALAVDLGLGWSKPLENVGDLSLLRVGAKVGNLGGSFKNSGVTLPANVTAGVSLDTYLTDAHEITVGADVGYYFNPSYVRGCQISVGAEYNLMQLVQLRAGYHYGQRRAYYPTYASLGAGLRFLHLRLDFAYLFARRNTALHNTYSISFGFDF